MDADNCVVVFMELLIGTALAEDGPLICSNLALLVLSIGIYLIAILHVSLSLVVVAG